MAILFVTHKFPPSIGGMQKQSYELVNGMVKKMKSFVIAQSPSESKFWFFLRLRSRILKMLKTHPEIDSIHCNDGVMAAFVALFAERQNIKYSCTFHGLDLIYPNRFYQNYILEKIKKFDAVFCVSRYTAEACLKRGFNPRRLHVVPNGVDFSIAEKTINNDFLPGLERKLGVELKGKHIIVSVGRAVRRKGFSWFIKEVMPRLNKDVVYIIAGPIDSSKHLLNRVFNSLPKNISHRLELFAGYTSDSREILKAAKNPTMPVYHIQGLSHDEIVQLYKHATLTVMPNISVSGDMEGFGLVALEANLAGCPVVVSPIEGITSAIIHEKNGWYVTSACAGSWADRIRSLLEDTGERQCMSVYARQYVLDNFSWNTMTDHYYTVLANLSANKPKITGVHDRLTEHATA